MAQDDRHQFMISAIASSDALSKYYIYRIDSFSEEYTESGGQGFGLGYSFTVFPFMSVEYGLERIDYNGIDTHIDRRVSFQDTYHLIGVKFHSSKSRTELGLSLSYIFSNSDIEYEADPYTNDLTGRGRGIRLAGSVSYYFMNHAGLRLETDVRALGNDYDDPGSSSFDITQMGGYGAFLKASLVFRI